MPLNVGIVGCGTIAHIIIENLEKMKIDDIRIGIILDRHPNRVEALSEKIPYDIVGATDISIIYQSDVDLVVDVKEAKTGYISFGGGYSSIEEFVGFVELRQRNFDYANWNTFTGAGQDISVMASLGSLSQRYQLSFTNPWIFDRPISFGFDAYRKGHSKDSDSGYGYEQEITGGAVRLGKRFNDNITGGVAYRFESIRISDIDATASQAFKDEAGTTNLSTLESSLSYDTRDNVFSPRKGILLTNALGVTGGFFGGDRDFIKYYGQAGFFFPMPMKSVIELRLRGGFADPFSFALLK